MATTTTAETTTTTTPTNVVTKEEMLDLVRAIKFAKPDASMRQVHTEIVEQLSQKESFEFLAQIPLTDVKKVWKKAVQESSVQRQENPDSASPLQHPEQMSQFNQVWKLFTVGDGSVRTLASEYSQAAAKAAIKQQQEQDQERALLMDHFVHVFLNVPADQSGQRPHQALINFNENTTGASKKMKKKKGSSTSANGTDSMIICKIQVAASPTAQKFPMLLYNQDRSMKTFIHPPSPDVAIGSTSAAATESTDDGYTRIYDLIMSQGSQGALGASGGAKAYFYARWTPSTGKGLAEDILSIDTRQLAPIQTW